MLEISGQTAGKYLILESVGHGGMSAIYKALDLTEDTTVALKVLSAAMASDPTFEARFSREIEVLRTLEHPHILPILDYGEIGGLAYIVMPFYRHGTLQDRINKGIALKQGSKIIKQVSEALEYAHAHGITHRDVKPTNILLDEKGNAVLSDFGFAHTSDSSLSLTGSALIGTPAYMSPEQCRGEDVDGNSDQYSLAVVIYQMVTGRPPFEADTPMGLVFKHMNDPVPNPRDINRKVPDEVEDVLLKALDKDPSRRYPSVAAFNKAFQAASTPYKSKLPPGARRWQRLRNRIRRFRRRISQSMHRLARSPKFMRRFRVGLAIAILFLVPLAVWAIGTFGLGGPNASPGMLYITQDPTDIAATVIAGVQTQAAGGEGAGMSDDEMSTAIAATVSAIRTAEIGGGMGGTGTPGEGEGTPIATPSASPRQTNTPRSPWRATATRTPYAGPSATPTPTLALTPTPTPTPTEVQTMHVSSLTVDSTRGNPNNWKAWVLIQINRDNGSPVSGATVSGRWLIDGVYSTDSCGSTDGGSCTVKSPSIKSSEIGATFEVLSVSGPYTYAPGDNVATKITIMFGD